MSGLVELKLQPAVAAALESFGYAADDAVVRDQLPAAARGTNLALAVPPSAHHAAPALAGLMCALAASEAQALVLAPPHSLEEWASVLLPLAESAGLTALVANQPGRATKRLREGQLRLLLTTPATALALLERSALKASQLGHVVLVWPELFESEEALTALMQEIPAEAQRILVLAAPKPAHPLVERYARRALFIGPLSNPDAGVVERPAVRLALVSRDRRAAALASLVESEDPATLVVWCAGPRSAAEAKSVLPVGDTSVQVLATEAVPTAALVVAWDLPSPAQMARLAAAGELLLLAPPHAAAHVAQVTSRQTPIRIRGALDQARDDAARRRTAVQDELDRGELDGCLLALAPLFERHDPARIAAALYRLWQAKPVEAVAPVVSSMKPTAEVARIWVGVGKKEGAGPADIVAALTRDLGLDAGKIGRIELREMFSLVEVPASEAEEIARALTGKTIRRRKVVAKVDGGRPSDGSRAPSGSSPRGRPARPRP
jgi:ATP-dependent RNA helicase DeaD